MVLWLSHFNGVVRGTVMPISDKIFLTYAASLAASAAAYHSDSGVDCATTVCL